MNGQIRAADAAGARQDRYAPYKDQEMVLGLRPEHLFEYHDAGQGRAWRALTRRSMWSSRWAWRRWCISSSTARRSAPASIPRPTAQPGEMLPLTADMNNMHLMEASSGRVV